MRCLCIMLTLNLATPVVAVAQAVPAPAASTASGKYSVDETTLGTLLDDPAAKAVLIKHVPAIVSNDQVEMARGFTLKSLQNYAADQLTDAKLTAINADLAKLPTKK